MKPLLFVAGLLAIGAGLLQITNRDMAWRSQEAINRRRGVRSERTDEWERASIGQGIIGIMGGIALLWLASL